MSKPTKSMLRALRHLAANERNRITYRWCGNMPMGVDLYGTTPEYGHFTLTVFRALWDRGWIEIERANRCGGEQGVKADGTVGVVRHSVTVWYTISEDGLRVLLENRAKAKCEIGGE